VSVPTSGSWSYSSGVEPGFQAISANGINTPDGRHFEASQVSIFEPSLSPHFVQYNTGLIDFTGYDTLDFTVSGQVGPGGIHIAWQILSGSDVISTGTDGGVINVNQLALPFTDPMVSMILFANHFDPGGKLQVSGFSTFTVDLHAYSTAVAPVPAPATLPLFATGLGLMGWFAWRRKRSIKAYGLIAAALGCLIGTPASATIIAANKGVLLTGDLLAFNFTDMPDVGGPPDGMVYPGGGFMELTGTGFGNGLHVSLFEDLDATGGT
jgi:hypothetical protein